jgi:hypothetical protein
VDEMAAAVWQWRLLITHCTKEIESLRVNKYDDPPWFMCRLRFL